MLLEKEHDVFNDENQQRSHCEMSLTEIKDLHKQIIDDLNHNRKRGKELINIARLGSKYLQLMSSYVYPHKHITSLSTTMLYKNHKLFLVTLNSHRTENRG